MEKDRAISSLFYECTVLLLWPESSMVVDGHFDVKPSPIGIVAAALFSHLLQSSSTSSLHSSIGRYQAESNPG
jgi:hypothetical protein